MTSTQERDRLIENHLALAHSIALRWWRAGGLVRNLGTVEDVQQVALHALVRAAHYFDPGRGTLHHLRVSRHLSTVAPALPSSQRPACPAMAAIL